MSRLPAAFACLLLAALPPARGDEGKVVREKVRGPSLAGNPAGESADRWVSVYLPPGYDAGQKRYPVLYLLHGIGDTDEVWTRGKGPYESIPGVMDRGVADRRLGEMIVVMPEQRTAWFGSFYTNSAWTGNWEDFTAKDLVAAIDGKYRTLARPAARGVAGHSMGGHGAIKLGMKHPDVFGVVYGMNPAVLGWGPGLSADTPAFAAVPKMTRDQVAAAGVMPAGIVCVAQAFSPNPKNPPFHADMPFALVGGKLAPSEPAFGKWEENMPVQMVRRYRANLQRLRGLRFDSGWDDEFGHIVVTARELSRTLTGQGIEHIFEEYNGDHRNRLWGRTGRLSLAVLPYFGLLLDPAEGPKK